MQKHTFKLFSLPLAQRPICLAAEDLHIAGAVGG
jgi:hypothetical protein